MQITCSGRGTQRRPGEGCWRSSPETRGVRTNRTTGKPGLLGVREVGLAEGHLLPLTRKGVGRAGPSINSLLTVAHHGSLCAWFLMCEAKNRGTHLPWVCRISPGIQGSGHVSCTCLLLVPLWLHPGPRSATPCQARLTLALLRPNCIIRATGRDHGRNRDHLVSKSLLATRPKTMESTSLSL